MDPHEPVPVASLTNPVQAELLKHMLESKGVSCEIEGGHQAGYVGVLEIRLLVPARHADHARKLLAEHGE